MKLSPTMQRCLDEIKSVGKIERHPGGFWIVPGSKESHGTTTVRSLVNRGCLKWGEKKNNRIGEFYVEALIGESK
jgi:hypothetical protein